MKILQLVAVSNAYTFEQYTKEYNKSYDSVEEYNVRKVIFENNLKKIENHPSKSS